MIQSQIFRWCSVRGWTEPRQLEDGLWVAFPPGGYIEMPLPDECQPQLHGKKNNIEYFILGCLLILVACVLGLLAVAISPLFSRRKTTKKSQGLAYSKVEMSAQNLA